MGFRKPQNLTRIAAGYYDGDGLWVTGDSLAFSIMASVQPVTGEDQIVLPEGKRLSDYVKVYTDAPLQVLGEVEGLQPDLLLWRGHTYECIQCDVRQMDVISHFKYVFSKLNQQ